MTRLLRAFAAAALLLLLIPLNGASAAVTSEAEYFASDATAGDLFGFSLDVDGTTAIVGAPSLASSGVPGKAYVFTFDGTSWSEQAILSAAIPVAGEQFGYDVAIDGDTVVVGARGAGAVGAAYVFTRTGSTWTQDDMLTTGLTDDQFGTSVDVLGTRIAVGAPTDDQFGSNAGAAYAFDNGGTWTQTYKIGSQAPASNGLFGNAVLLDPARLYVGAPIEANDGFALAGAAYVHDAATGTHLQTLKPSDQQDFHGFGASFSYDNNTLVIGANGDSGPDGFDPTCDNGGNCSPGSVYIYTDSGSGFVDPPVELHAIDLETAPNFSPGAQFGIETDLDDGVLIVGARNNDGIQVNQGKAHVFDLLPSGWVPREVIGVSDQRQGDLAGSAVAIHGTGDTFLIGVPNDDNANGLGAANEGAFYDITAVPEFCDGLQATILGTDGDDIIEGTDGDDVIVARDGRDVIVTGGGVDVICGGDGDDVIVANAGNDRVFGEGGDDVVVGGNGRDTVSGGADADVIVGWDGRDTLNGDAGDDRISGGNGRDTIDGGADVDQCIGGPGNNTITNCE